MRYSIFRKAELIKHKVVKTDEKGDKAYYTFKDMNEAPLITIVSKGKYTYLESCTCRHHSIYGGFKMEILCSYTLAVYKSIGKEHTVVGVIK